MKPGIVVAAAVALLVAFAAGARVTDTKPAAPTPPKYPDYPSETPAKFKPTTDGHDYVRRIAEIPMRDGVKLHTVILVPKGAKHEGILMTRTPYDADSLTANTPSGRLATTLQGYDNATDVIVEDGYTGRARQVRL